jgi:hypothetical protein
MGWSAAYLAVGYAINVLLLAREVGLWSEELGRGLAVLAAAVVFLFVMLGGEEY